MVSLHCMHVHFATESYSRIHVDCEGELSGVQYCLRCCWSHLLTVIDKIHYSRSSKAFVINCLGASLCFTWHAFKVVSIRKFLQTIHAGLSLAHRQVGENGIIFK